MSPGVAAAVVVIVALAAIVQSTTGFGFALLAVPLLSFAIDAKLAVVMSTTLSFFGSSWLARQEWASRDRRTVRVMILGSAIGSPFGLVLLEVASARALRFGLAAMIAVFLAITVRGFRLERTSVRTDLLFGTMSGVLNTSLSTNGPPLVMVLHARHLPPPVFRSTLAVVFSAANTIAIVLFAASSRYDAEAMRALAVAIPALIAGLVVGRVASRHLPVGAFRHLVLVLLAVTAVASFAGALVASG